MSSEDCPIHTARGQKQLTFQGLKIIASHLHVNLNKHRTQRKSEYPTPPGRNKIHTKYFRLSFSEFGDSIYLAHLLNLNGESYV